MQYRWPLDRVSLLQGFGDNPNARGYGPLGHQGIDIRTRYVDCPQGDRTVCAPADGIVQPTIFEANGFGHHVHIRHADGTSTICAHLKSKSVADHAAVTAGQPIGIAGNTGRSSDHHLHFELRNAANQAIDPMPFLDASQIDRMPVDSRYGKPLDFGAEMYVRSFQTVEFVSLVRPLRLPTQREINGMAYGGWSAAEVTDAAMWELWIVRPK